MKLTQEEITTLENNGRLEKFERYKYVKGQPVGTAPTWQTLDRFCYVVAGVAKIAKIKQVFRKTGGRTYVIERVSE